MISRRSFLIGCLPAALTACSTNEIVRTISTAARGGSLQGAVTSVATSKAQGWVRNPSSLKRDFENLDSFIKKFVREVVDVWGDDNATQASEKVFVKYSDDYKSRGVIDFERSIVRVETLLPGHLKKAIVTTVLSPDDPRSVDIFSNKDVKLGGEPFLYKQVVDHDGKAIRWGWRANRFADYLIAHKKQTREITLNNGDKKIETFVEFPLLRTHNATRQNKYSPLVNKYAAKYGTQVLVRLLKVDRFHTFCLPRPLSGILEHLREHDMPGDFDYLVVDLMKFYKLEMNMSCILLL